MTAAAGAPPLLTLDRVTKRFGGLTAVREVSLTVPAGDLLGIIGPNGAGKTTLFNVISGYFRPDEGRVRLRRPRRHRPARPRDLHASG